MSTKSTKKKKKLDQSLKNILFEIGGNNCVKVARELYNIEEEEITDDQLAEVCGIKLNIVRKILYILYDNKISVFRKVRDKKSGWFIYYWREEFAAVKELIKNKQELVLEKLLYRLDYENNNVFYICQNMVKPPKKETGKKKHSDPYNIPKNLPEFDENELICCNHLATFNEALDENFICVKCKGTLTSYDNTKVKEFLMDKVAILRQNIKNCG